MTSDSMSDTLFGTLPDELVPTLSPWQAQKARQAVQPVARSTDPVTSHLAAIDASSRAQTNRDLALATLRSHPSGLTDFDLADLTGIAQTSIGKRRGELRDAGLVEDSGRHRPSPSGSAAIVWVAK